MRQNVISSVIAMVVITAFFGFVYPLVMTGADGEERSDPTTIPAPSDAQFAQRADDRLRGVIAACRRRDGARAKMLAAGLLVELKTRAVNSCVAFAVDL